MINYRKWKFIFAIVVTTYCYAGLSQEVIESADYDKNVELNTEGWDLIHKGQFEKAVTTFRQAMEFNSNNADSYVGAATAYMKSAQYKNAAIYVDSALSLTEDQSDISYLAGNINFHLGNFKRSINYYTTALNDNEISEVKIDKSNCYFNRGNAYLSLDEYKKAIADFDRVLEEVTDFSDAYHNRGIAKKNLSQNAEACSDFHAAFNLGSEISKNYLDDCSSIKYQVFSTAAREKLNPTSKKSPSKKVRNTTPVLEEEMIDTLYFTETFDLCARPKASYYRVGLINTKKLLFVGSFTDYYMNGAIMVTGQYNKEGKKSGEFERYLPDGTPYSKGHYQNDEQMGTWHFYHIDGSLSETIEFTEDDFNVIESYDEKGNVGVKNGKGKWKKLISKDQYASIYLTGKYKNGLKTGTWMLESTLPTIFHKEKYKNGKFVSAMTRKSVMAILGAQYELVPATQLFNKTYFLPQSLELIEKFKPSITASRDDYPYMKNLKREAEIIIPPSYPGGMKLFYRFVSENLSYPAQARENNIEGRVVVRFKVSKMGTSEEIETLSDLGGGLEDEAKRIINLIPEWEPALQNGELVDDYLTLPIIFKTMASVPFKVNN